MQGISRQVSSNQQHLHHKLAAVVQRHLETTHRAAVSSHSEQAYQQLTRRLAKSHQPLVLDSFCGTGHSTASLASRHPEHLIVGIDKSAARLAKHPGGEASNYLLLQANCEDIWELLVADGFTVDFHYLFYPNPWPKAKHLQRRVHGHASFPLLPRLGGHIELRSNWQVYVEEFGVAMFMAGQHGHIGKVKDGEPTVSLFEQKYRNSAHELWSYTGCIMP